MCREPGNAWALQRAKHNLVNNYLVVGVTERLTEFVAVMEVVLPRFFKGATKRFILGMYLYCVRSWLFLSILWYSEYHKLLSSAT